MTQIDISSKRALRHRAQQLASLGQLPAFQSLRTEMEKKTDRVRVSLHSLLLREDISAATMQRQADYDRGFVDGMRYVTVEVVAGAARRLEQDIVVEETEREEDYWRYG